MCVTEKEEDNWSFTQPLPAIFTLNNLFQHQKLVGGNKTALADRLRFLWYLCGIFRYLTELCCIQCSYISCDETYSIA